MAGPDLIWRFHEALKEFNYGAPALLSFAVVPMDEGGWAVLINRKQQVQYSLWAGRVRSIGRRRRKAHALRD